MAKAVRMADIAEKLNVSVVTVSKALSGKDGVGSELREAIIKTADEMGYSTNKKNDSSNSDSLLIGILNAHRYLEKGSSFYWIFLLLQMQFDFIQTHHILCTVFRKWDIINLIFSLSHLCK